MAALVLQGLVAWAAPFNVTGTVKDQTGEPLIGVSVKAENSKTGGATTDLDGNFTLSMNAPGNIEFSYVGMEPQKVKVAAATKLDIVLKENANTLDDVVVVGYGTQRKVNLTGSVQSVSSDEIIRRSVSNGSQALQGIVPGLSAVQGGGGPGADAASIKIRGQGSLNSDTAPLVLIDGVEGDMNRIDLNSVESISVLKDAASASIYGSRASNGVILITTKRGAQGKPKVTFNGYVGWNKPTEIPETVNAVTYLGAVDQANINAGGSAQYTDIINSYLEEGSNNFGRYDTNWRDMILKKSAMVQNYSVGVSGGSEFLNVYATGGYYNQDGMVENNSFKRYNLRVNSDMKINKWIKLGVDMGMRQAEAVAPIGGANTLIGYALTFQPILGAVDIDPETNIFHYGYGLQGNNPYATINGGGISKSVAPEYTAKAQLTVNPYKGVTLLGSWNFKRNDGRTKTFADKVDLYEAGVYKLTTPTKNAVRESWSRSDFTQFMASAQYENTFGKNYVKAFVGFQSENTQTHSIEGYRSDYNYDGYHELVHGDASTATNSSYSLTYSMLSYIFRVNYSFNERYLLEVNGRYDGTSRFKQDKRWGFFPSASAGWRISEESFIKDNQSVLNNLKLRASYGLLGNQSISSYFPYVSAVSNAEGYGYWFDGVFTPGVAQTQLANELIGWEKSKQFNVGLDWGLFNSRLTGGFDYYIRRIEDMLQQFPVPEFVALTAPWQNAGSMRNNGWELSLGWNDRIGDWSYYAKFNLSDVRNKVLNLYGNEYKGTTLTAAGHPYGQYFGYVADGLFQSQEEIDAVDVDGNYIYAVYGDRNTVKPGYIRYKDLDGSGTIDGYDRKIIGDPVPHFEFGLSLGAEWKGIDLSVFFQGVGKKDVIYTGAGARPLLGNGTIYKHQLDSWTPENPNAKYPLLINDVAASSSNNLFSSFWVKSGAYCRVKNITLGYTIPRKWTRKAFIERVRIYGTLNNIWTIKGSDFYKGFDPEQSGGATCYPLNKSYIVGLQLDF